MESSFFSHQAAVTLDFPAAFRALRADGRWAMRYWAAHIWRPAGSQTVARHPFPTKK